MRLLPLVLLAACAPAPVDGGPDGGDTVDDGAADTEAAETDAGDSEAADSDAPPDTADPGDTDTDHAAGDSDPPGDTDPVGPPDTDTGGDTDTDVAADTDLGDSDPGDTDPGVVDTVVGGADTEPVDPDTDTADSAAPADSDTDRPPADSDLAGDTDPGDTADTAPLPHTDPPVDADGDGHAADVDCDDADPAAFPGAPERCDGRRNDCDRPWAGDDGTASFVDGAGAWTDVAAAFPASGVAASWAPPGDGTLWLCTGVHHARITLATGTLDVRGRGGAVVLDGDAGGSVVFASVGTTLALRDVTLTDGLAPYGGGLRAVEAHVSLTDVVVRGNTSSGTGGGLSVATYGAGTLDLVRTRIEDNVAGGDGGGAYLGLVGTSRARLEDVTVVRNRARGYTGGGVCAVPWDDAVFVVDGARFEDNLVGLPGNPIAYGGGLWVDASTRTELGIGDATFRGNQAVGDPLAAWTAHGGGLGVRQRGTGTVRVTDAVAEGNTAGVDVAGLAIGLGGGIYVGTRTADVVLLRPTLSGNVVGGGASTAAGGGLWIGTESLVAVTGRTWEVVDGRLSGNQASGQGGGLTVDHGPLTLRGTTSDGDLAGRGGGVAVLGGTLDLRDGSTIRGGTATYGGAATLDGGTLTCASSPAGRSGWLGNLATAEGGGVWRSRTSDVVLVADCDLGATGSADDNLDVLGPSDVAPPAFAAGDPASFTCDTTGCR